MKFLTSIILTALLAFVAGLYLPWWSLAITSFLIALLIHQRSGLAFLSGFIGLFLLWGALAWWMDMENQGLLSAKIARIFPLGGSSVLLILITGFIGALVAGFAALSGSYLRSRRAVD